MMRFSRPASPVVFSMSVFAIQVNLLFAVEPYRSQCLRNGDFKPGEKGYSLSVNILSTQQVTGRMDCAVNCMDHEECKSYNYQHQSSGSTHTCELLDKIKDESPNDYTSRSGFTYYESTLQSQDPCQNNPCKNGGTCISDCSGYICTCIADVTGRHCEIDERVFASCAEIQTLQPVVDPGAGYQISVGSKVIKVFCDNGWTLIARFSNADGKNWMENTAAFWYTREEPYGLVGQPDANGDMLSEAFWVVQGTEFRITKSNDPTHTELLKTTGSCLNGKTFRQKIASFGTFTGSMIWGTDSCQGKCSVSYGGSYTTVSGFAQSQCNGDLQSSGYIGFFCDYSAGDGAVMMIGGGGSACSRADHGIGLTEANEAQFAGGGEADFGDDPSIYVTTYALNLWVR